LDKDFFNRINKNPIIAAINDISKLDDAIDSPCEVIFLLTGNIFNLKSIVDRVKSADMGIYVHIDLIEGFSKDMIALEYINKNIKPDGVITTKNSLIRAAKSMNIFSIQRLFILDSLALESGIRSIHTSRPDAIEVLPGIMPKILRRIHQETRIPIIAGGLIEDKEDIIQCLKADSIGISTSMNELWYE